MSPAVCLAAGVFFAVRCKIIIAFLNAYNKKGPANASP